MFQMCLKSVYLSVCLSVFLHLSCAPSPTFRRPPTETRTAPVTNPHTAMVSRETRARAHLLAAHLPRGDDHD